MNRLTLLLCTLLLVLLSSALTSCRTRPPVVRHFLRMPAEYAGGLSSIERVRWLKEYRKQLPPRRELVATGHLTLPAYATALGTRLNGMEILFAPGQNSGPAGIAILRKNDSHPAPVFLRYGQACYLRTSPNLSAPGGPPSSWHIDPATRAVIGSTAGGRRTLELQWSGSDWRSHAER
jgi:hypothetical protein